jgi:hypothetical protein
MNHNKVFLGLFSLLFLGFSTATVAQDSLRTTGAIRGRLLDKSSKVLLKKGLVELMNFSPPRVVAVDENTGQFALEDVPVGRHRIAVRVDGFESAFINSINVVAGKAEFMTIELTEDVRGAADPLTNAEIGNGTPIVAPVIKDPFILMDNTVGEHRFNTDEVNRFSGGRNDPARLAASFAGVANSDDTRNDLIVRGATPLGVQWLLEGLPIQNPNHLSYPGTTSGFFPILNTNTLEAADFRLGSFSAQYANSSTGIFDIHLRNGSYSEVGVAAQLSINGGELVVEGPMFKKRGAFLIASRYSALQLFERVPLVFQFNARTLPITYDVNFNFQYLSKKAGEFNVFGFYGSSKFVAEADEFDNANVFNPENDGDAYWQNYNGVVGLKHRLFLSDRTFWQTTLGANISYSDMERYFYQKNDSGQITNQYRGLNSKNYQAYYTLSTYINSKVNRKFSWRAGLLVQQQQNELFALSNRYNIYPVVRHDYIGGQQLIQTYLHTNWRLASAVRLQMGVVGLYNGINQQLVAEPRINLSFDLAKKHQLDLIYTIQHQQLSPQISFLQLSRFDAMTGSTAYDRSAQSLKMMANQYFMLEYAYQPQSYWQIKVSPYYRYWFNLPVQADRKSGYSLYNADGDLPNNLPQFPLKSTGTAENYGIDLTLQRYFNKGFQLLATASYFSSTYKGSDDSVRNSRFDRNLIGRLAACKEWNFGKNKAHVFFLSSTFTWAAGERYTAIDTLQSAIFRNEVLTQDWYALRTPFYMRWDVKVGFRINRRRSNHYIYVDVTNVLNRQNVLTYRYDVDMRTINPVYQFGRLPEIFYRIQF